MFNQFISMFTSKEDKPISQRVRDLSKRAIEVSTEELIKAVSSVPVQQLQPVPIKSSGQTKVAPGLVSWHPDLQSASLAALRSKKPILLFQLMGELDEPFC